MALALKNFELANNLPTGTATVELLEESSIGIDGFLNWVPEGEETEEDFNVIDTEENEE